MPRIKTLFAAVALTLALVLALLNATAARAASPSHATTPHVSCAYPGAPDCNMGPPTSGGSTTPSGNSNCLVSLNGACILSGGSAPSTPTSGGNNNSGYAPAQYPYYPGSSSGLSSPSVLPSIQTPVAAQTKTCPNGLSVYVAQSCPTSSTSSSGNTGNSGSSNQNNSSANSGSSGQNGPTSSSNCSPVGPPTNVQANAVDQTDITVTWTDPYNDNGACGFYVVDNQGGACAGASIVGCWEAWPPGSMSYTVSGLTPGTQGCYHVFAGGAFQGDARSPNSATVCATTFPSASASSGNPPDSSTLQPPGPTGKILAAIAAGLKAAYFSGHIQDPASVSTSILGDLGDILSLVGYSVNLSQLKPDVDNVLRYFNQIIDTQGALGCASYSNAKLVFGRKVIDTYNSASIGWAPLEGLVYYGYVTQQPSYDDLANWIGNHYFQAADATVSSYCST